MPILRFRRTSRCGDPYGRAGTQRRRNPAGLWLYQSDAWTRYAVTAGSRTASGSRPAGSDLVFCTGHGEPLLAGNVRRTFRRLCRKAGIGDDWTPRELRHSFVSLLSDSGVPLEAIADLCGHSGTTVTEKVYRQQLRPVLLGGAIAMDKIFETPTGGGRVA